MAKERPGEHKPHEGGEIVPHHHISELAPFRGIESFFAPVRQMERMMEEMMGGRAWPLMTEEFAAPAVDVYEEGDEVVMKAELPGMTKKDVEVNITDHTMTITGEKTKEEKVEKQNYYRMERSEGHFIRSFTLPPDLEADKSKAVFKDGVLEIRIPKSEEAKRKKQKIEIE